MTDSSRYLVLIGGAGCFTGKQLITTIQGLKPISSISIGDSVKSYNHETKENEWRKVTDLHTFKNHPDKIIRIKMKSGKVIEVTENHLFYYGGAYVKIKDILLSLQHGNMEKNTKL